MPLKLLSKILDFLNDSRWGSSSWNEIGKFAAVGAIKVVLVLLFGLISFTKTAIAFSFTQTISLFKLF
jgi:hypothetical protein